MVSTDDVSSDWTSVKSTNGQLTDGLIWSFIKIAGTLWDKIQIIRGKK
jgi:hypothetical protein